MKGRQAECRDLAEAEGFVILTNTDRLIIAK